MGITAILALVFLAIICVLLVLIVLLQNEEGDGLGGLFGGGGGNSFAPRTGNILTKITTVLAIIFFTIAILFAFLVGPGINKRAGMADDGMDASADNIEANTWSEVVEEIEFSDEDEVLIEQPSSETVEATADEVTE